MLITFRPLNGAWGAPMTPKEDRRSETTFRAGWADTKALLTTELTWLGASTVVLETDHQAGQISKAGTPFASARDPLFPGVRLSFTSAAGPLTFATDKHWGWRTNARAIGLGMKALRAVDRYGIGTGREQYTGWAQLTAGPSVAWSDSYALSVIVRHAGGPDAVDLGDLRTAFRVARINTHPDRGGKAEDFDLVSKAGKHLGLV